MIRKFLAAALLALCAQLAAANMVVTTVGARHPTAQAEEPPAEGLLYAIDGVEITPDLYACEADQGNGSGSSEANCMDLPTALTTIAAGQDLGILPGHYQGASNLGEPKETIFNTANAGTAGNPIRIIGKYNPLEYCEDGACSSPELLTRLGATERFYDIDDVIGGLCPIEWTDNSAIFGNRIGTDYVEWYNLYADAADDATPATGGVMYIGGAHTVAAQIAIHYVALPDCDNFNAIHNDGANDTTIRRVYVFDDETNNYGNHNTCAITLYSAENHFIENITVEGTECAIFTKGDDNSYGTQRYNLAKDMTGTCFDVGETHETEDTEVYQNVCIRSAVCFRFDGSSPDRGHYNKHLYNNTCIDAISGAGSQETGCFVVQNRTPYTSDEWRDNLCVFTESTSGLMIDLGNTAATTGWDAINFNQYCETGVAAQYAFNSGSPQNLAAYRTALGGTFEDDSDEACPTFQAGTDNVKRSDGDMGSSTGGPRGAYITNSELIGAHAQ